MIDDKKRYELIDCDGLATLLAEDAWEEEVKLKGLSQQDLYEDIPGGKQIKPCWASSFFTLREAYLSLIAQHKMNMSCNLPEDQTQ